MTEQIEQLLLSEDDNNIRLGLTLYFSQNVGDLYELCKWINNTEPLTNTIPLEIAKFFQLTPNQSVVHLVIYIKETFKIPIQNILTFEKYHVFNSENEKKYMVNYEIKLKKELGLL